MGHSTTLVTASHAMRETVNTVTSQNVSVKHGLKGRKGCSQLCKTAVSAPPCICKPSLCMQSSRGTYKHLLVSEWWRLANIGLHSQPQHLHAELCCALALHLVCQRQPLRAVLLNMAHLQLQHVVEHGHTAVRACLQCHPRGNAQHRKPLCAVCRQTIDTHLCEVHHRFCNAPGNKVAEAKWNEEEPQSCKHKCSAAFSSI